MKNGFGPSEWFLVAVFVLVGAYLWWSRLDWARRTAASNEETKRNYDEYLEAAKQLNRESNHELLDEVKAIRKALENRK